MFTPVYSKLFHRSLTVAALLLGTLLLLGHRQEETPIPAAHKNFSTGEMLTYKISFGIFTLGTCMTTIASKLHHIHARPCYKVNARGATSGLIAHIAKVNDRFGAYVDTANLVSHIFYRKLKEGDYRKDEITLYNQQKNTVEVKEKDQKTGHFKTLGSYPVAPDVRDLLSGFLYIRTLDFAHMSPGDTITFPAFLGDTSYSFSVLYKGIEPVRTDWGRISCIKLSPIMPENSIFDGKNAVAVWISNDKNKIPVKAQAKLFVGNFRIEITGFKGLEHTLKVMF